MPSLAPKIKLNNGQEMPVIGLGTWRSYELEAEMSTNYAIDAGYRMLDTAFVYDNELEVGSAIKTKIKENVIKREDLFVVTKLAGIHHEPKSVEPACRKSLENLGLAYLDQYLIHFPVAQTSRGSEVADVDYLDTWKAMEKLVDAGLVRGIGLSNFNAEQTERILKNCRIKPVVNQVECHPCFNQKKLIEFSRERGIVITAYCPLARPDQNKRWPPFIFDKNAQTLAQKYHKTTAQVALRYLIQLGVVPIPKSVRQQRIEENFNIFDFELSDEDMDVMARYNTGQRIVPFSGMKDHKYFPFNTEF